MTPKVVMFNMDVGEQPKDGVTKDKEGCCMLVKPHFLVAVMNFQFFDAASFKTGRASGIYKVLDGV